jgi:hypothetical protein
VRSGSLDEFDHPRISRRIVFISLSVRKAASGKAESHPLLAGARKCVQAPERQRLTYRSLDTSFLRMIILRELFMMRGAATTLTL